MPRLVFILFLLFGAFDAYGQRYIGHDFLGAEHPNFKVKRLCKLLKQRTPLGYLDYTFSPSTTNFVHLLRCVRPRIMRVHILDVVCVRNRNCGSYSVLKKYSRPRLNKAIINQDPKIFSHYTDRVLIYKDLQAQFPKTRFLISPVLEHNLSRRAWRVLAKHTRLLWSNVRLVNNPHVSKAERYLGALTEKHGNQPEKSVDISSLDGVSPYKIDVKEWLNYTKKERVTYMHASSYNCREDGKFIDPRKRTKCLTVTELRKLINKVK